LTADPDLAGRVKQLALEAGYDACGLTTAEPFTDFAEAVEGRIERFPEAAHLYEGLRRRADPRERNPWARSVAVCVHRYGKYRSPPGVLGRIGRSYLFDRRCKRSPETELPKRFRRGLKSLGIRARKGGCPDRAAAARAGVAALGRNCFAISPEFGSWINVETWLLDAELPADQPTPTAPCPEGCTACLDACPTGAIVEPYLMRMDRCVAWLTYGAPEPIAPELWEQMGEWVYGCDRCQQVCPLNEGKWEEREGAPWLEEVADRLQPAALAEMDEKTYREVVHPLFWYIPDDAEGLERWRRNARRALLNADCGR
jgi:epoxyqueuosine reductase